MIHYPIYIIAAPLFAGLFSTVLGYINPRYAQPVTFVGLAISLFASIKVLMDVVAFGPMTYHLAGWVPPVGIGYVVDHLNAVVLVMVAAVAVLVNVFSIETVKEELSDKIHHFYALSTLMVTGLLGITITGDAFNLYVLLEVSSLTGYALIAFGRGRAYLASFNYIIIGSIGASFYLLGVGYLLLKTGTLNMADLYPIVTSMNGSAAMVVAFTLIMVGFFVKMALYPMHGWLPNAYTHAPVASSCLVAPLVTKVSVYVMLRMMLSVFSLEYVFSLDMWMTALQWLAAIAVIAGSVYALSQRHLKRMLSYIIVAEIGYMVGGAWLGNSAGLTGAIFHILADGLMTLTMFLVVGAIIHKIGHGSFESMKGIFQKMPVTMIAFLVAAMSMIGVPPTPGFFSKFYLLSGAYLASAWPFFVALIVSSLVNAVLFFRLIEIGFFSAMPGEDPTHPHNAVDEAPLTMLVPIVICAVLLLAMGLYSGEIINTVINPIFAEHLY